MKSVKLKHVLMALDMQVDTNKWSQFTIVAPFSDLRHIKTLPSDLKDLYSPPPPLPKLNNTQVLQPYKQPLLGPDGQGLCQVKNSIHWIYELTPWLFIINP